MKSSESNEPSGRLCEKELHSAADRLRVRGEALSPGQASSSSSSLDDDGAARGFLNGYSSGGGGGGGVTSRNGSGGGVADTRDASRLELLKSAAQATIQAINAARHLPPGQKKELDEVRVVQVEPIG